MTEYSQYIDGLLKPKVQEPAVVLDLFAGCGGLSLGFEAVGLELSVSKWLTRLLIRITEILKENAITSFLK